MACYVPTGGGSTIYNITGRGGDLPLGTSGIIYRTSNEGQGAYSAVANTTGATLNIPSQFQFTGTNTRISLYWRGFQVTQNSTNSNVFIGIGFNSSPFFDYSITASILTGTDVGLSWNSGGSGTNSATAFTPTSGTIGSYGGVFSVGGNAIFYNNGLQFDSTAFGATAPTYNSTDQLIMGGFPGSADGRTPNTVAHIGCIWNRALTATEMAYLDKNPYSFLIFPDDELFADVEIVNPRQKRAKKMYIYPKF